MSKLKLSKPAPIAERFELVQISCSDADGNPYVVRCEAVKGQEALAILKMLPGRRPKLGLEEEAADTGLDRLFDLCMRLVEAGTALAAPAGGFVRPAFWFDPEKPRDQLSVDGRALPIPDVILMGETIAGLSGYREVAAKKSFRGRHRT